MNQVINDAVVSIISSEKPAPRDIIRLAMWIRFSSPPEEYRSACIAATASYVEQRHSMSGKTMSGNPAFLGMAGDIIDLDFILDPHRDKIYSPFFPILWHYSQKQFHESSEIADAIHFLLWYKPATKDRRYQASLNRAYWYISNHGFRGKSQNVWRTFLKLWAKHRNAAGLIYAAEYLVDETWILDPMDPNFAAAIDSLCDRTAVLRLLSAAKTFDQALDRILHPRTRAGIERAIIPGNVGAASLETVALQERVYARMAEYEPESSPEEEVSEDYRPETI
jgi:hypothetical protein